MFSFDATFYDGRSSEPHRVRVHVDYVGSLRLVGDGFDRHFAARELRFAPRLGDTLRSISLPDDQKLETADNDAVDALAKVFGKGSHSGWVDRLERSWPMVLVSLVGVVLALGAGAIWGIPLGARLVAAALPEELAHKVGTDTLAALDRTLFDPSDADPWDRDRAEESFERMAAFHPELPLHLELRSLGSANAFALPDGTVVVSDELLELADDDDELAAVIAHEIGHVHYRHGVRMVLESSSVALLIGAYLGDVGQISTVLAAMPAAYSQAGYSRAHESEADEFALELMHRAGVAPHHFASILQKLSEEAGSEDDGASRYLSSHPSTQERIQRFEEP